MPPGLTNSRRCIPASGLTPFTEWDGRLEAVLSDGSGFYHVEFDQSVHLDGVFHG